MRSSPALTVRDRIEYRAHQIALAVSRDPMHQVPFGLACIPEVQIELGGDPEHPLPYLRNMLMRYNMDQYDRLTEKGYALNLTTEEYEKVHD